jgi:serine/threonine-protein kinase ATR
MRATLQTAFENKGLADLAFAAWAKMATFVGEEDIEFLIDHTFAIIVQYWKSFDSATHTIAHDTVAQLLKKHNSLIRDRIEMVPNLPGIPLLQKFDGEITRLKHALELNVRIDAFSRRCQDENAIVVRQALLELAPFLALHQKVIHESAMSQQPASGIAQLYRSLLDATIRLKEVPGDILELCAKCIGILGSIDPNMVESTREKQEVLMLSNFERAHEVIDVVATMLETVLIKAFHSAPTGKAQSYLAYTMQELLKFCGFKQAVESRSKASQGDPAFQRWLKIPEAVRSTLTPYFNTKYYVMSTHQPEGVTFPIFKPTLRHGAWLRTFVFYLLHKTARGDNQSMIFPVLAKVIWGHDLSIPTFILPFVIQNALLWGFDHEVEEIRAELLAVLSCDISELQDQAEIENVKQCSEVTRPTRSRSSDITNAAQNVFQVLDYLSRWLQENRRITREYSAGNQRGNHVPVDFDNVREVRRISTVDRILCRIEADVIARRAMECGSYARALFHWEQYIRTLDPEEGDAAELDDALKELQTMYAKIEEPDAIEGISAQLMFFDPQQQILDHKRAGRWNAAQSWYEVQLLQTPGDQVAQLELLKCLKASGQHGKRVSTFPPVIS